MSALLCALGFFLVLEGLFPFLDPEKWKSYIQELLKIPNEKVRILGLVSVVLGLIIIWST